MPVPTKDKYPENIVNPNFQKLLNRFHTLIFKSPKPEKIKVELDALKGHATEIFITPHQRDAIHARCNNYLNGTYASTSRPKPTNEKAKN